MQKQTNIHVFITQLPIIIKKSEKLFSVNELKCLRVESTTKGGYIGEKLI